jgi:4-hydroxy-tetrahydrodipicolinate synthase
MIAGTGSNHTDYAVDLTKYACSVGYDAMLVVTPYYNKATQNGLVKMYEAIGQASAKPLIVYNVPSRTGVNIEPATYAKLMNVPNVKAVKEASGNISKVLDTVYLTGGKLDLYSGNDDQIVPMLSIGAKGVISVLSNVLPKETHAMCYKYFNGDVKGALADQVKYLPLIHALFSEVNPIPVKAAMAAMGYGKNYVRLPLTVMEEEHQKVLFEEMRKCGVLE